MTKSFKIIPVLLFVCLANGVLAENLNNDKKQQAIEKLAKLKVEFNSDQWLKNAASGDLRILKIMHNAGFKVNQIDPFDHSGILHHASANGQNLVISWALKQFVDPVIEINKKDVNGFTALDWAAYHGQAETVRLLLENQADPNLHPHVNNPLLILGIQSGSLQTVKALLIFEPDLIKSTFDGQSSISAAKLSGNKQMIESVNQAMGEVQ